MFGEGDDDGLRLLLPGTEVRGRIRCDAGWGHNSKMKGESWESVSQSQDVTGGGKSPGMEGGGGGEEMINRRSKRGGEIPLFFFFLVCLVYYYYYYCCCCHCC